MFNDYDGHLFSELNSSTVDWYIPSIIVIGFFETQNWSWENERRLDHIAIGFGICKTDDSG